MWRRGLLAERVKMHQRISATSFDIGVFKDEARLSVMAERDDAVVPIGQKLDGKLLDQRSAMATDGIFERWSFHSCKVRMQCYAWKGMRERRESSGLQRLDNGVGALSFLSFNARITRNQIASSAHGSHRKARSASSRAPSGSRSHCRRMARAWVIV